MENLTARNTQRLAELKASDGDQDRAPKIWAVGGGKGGVGKTLLAANVAITLARTGARVIVLDLDLGGANMHTALGVDSSGLPSFTDYFERKIVSMQELARPACVNNLQIISGAQDSISIANISHVQKQKLLSKIRTLSCDYVVLDLGAGTTFNTLDFFLSADVGILTVLPESTSVENTYRFIKSAFYRKLKHVERAFDVHNMVDRLMERKAKLNIATPADLLRQLEREHPMLGSRVRSAIQNFDLKFVLNQIRTQADVDVGYGIRNVCRKYFGLSIDYLGHLEYDSAVWQSVRRKRPLALEFPASPIMPKVQGIVGTLLKEEVDCIQQANPIKQQGRTVQL